jgi:signal transduction histidine kinase
MAAQLPFFAIFARRMPASSCATRAGIDAKHLETVFEPYMQVAPLDGKFRSGLGIGLAVAKELVQMHGGTVFARSDGLGGGEFVVIFPLHAMAV